MCVGWYGLREAVQDDECKQWDAYIGVRMNIPLSDGGLTSRKVRESLAPPKPLTSKPPATSPKNAAETSGRVALEANQMGYEVGLRINSDVLNAQQQLFTTRWDLMRAQVDALVATLRLKASVGGLGKIDIQELDKWLK